MRDGIPLHLAVEDILSEAVVREMLRQSGRRFTIGNCFGKRGNGYLRKNIFAFNNSAKFIPYLVLTDLDALACPTMLIDSWMHEARRHPNLILRIAVHEVEAWVMAHREAFAWFLGISPEMIPEDLDSVKDPKEYLLGLSSRSRYSDIHRDLLPSPHSFRKVGPGYNSRLIQFVQKHWRADEAKRNSKSLSHAMRVIHQFEPRWEG